METLDLAKLKDVLDMMVDSGAVFLKYNELIIEFPRNGIRLEATPQNDDAAAAINAAKIAGLGPQKPVGYSAIFGNKMPRFSRPSVEGK